MTENTARQSLFFGCHLILCITGPKILAKLHATVWELGEFSRSTSANR